MFRRGLRRTATRLLPQTTYLLGKPFVRSFTTHHNILQNSYANHWLLFLVATAVSSSLVFANEISVWEKKRERAINERTLAMEKREKAKKLIIAGNLDPSLLKEYFKNFYQDLEIINQLNKTHCLLILNILGKEYISNLCKTTTPSQFLIGLREDLRWEVCKFLEESQFGKIFEISITFFAPEDRIFFLEEKLKKSPRALDKTIAEHSLLKEYLQVIPDKDHRKFLFELIGIDKLIQTLQVPRCYTHLHEIFYHLNKKDRSEIVKKITPEFAQNYFIEKYIKLSEVEKIINLLDTQHHKALLLTIPQSWFKDNLLDVKQLSSLIDVNMKWNDLTDIFNYIGKDKINSLIKDPSDLEVLIQGLSENTVDIQKLKKFLNPQSTPSLFQPTPNTTVNPKIESGPLLLPPK